MDRGMWMNIWKNMMMQSGKGNYYKFIYVTGE